MKKIANLALCALTLGLAACSQQDEPIQGTITGNPANSEKDVYASLTIKLPSAGSRAEEGDEDVTPNYANNGYEIGKEFENKVSRILIVLAQKEGEGDAATYKFLTHATSDSKYTGDSGDDYDPKDPQPEIVNETSIKYTLTFSSADMSPIPALDQNGNIPGATIYVFAYCNPTDNLISTIGALKSGDSFTDKIGSIVNKDDATIWTADKFLMTNSKISAPVEIPSRDILIRDHNAPTSAFNLGTVSVERVAARFDFATTTIKEELGVNVYPITDFENVPIGYVELTDMAMFNIARDYYYLPQISKSWSWTNPFPCGNPEAVGNYVVSPNESGYKSATNLSVSTIKSKFYSALVGNSLTNSESGNQRLVWQSISDWNRVMVDENDGWVQDKNDSNVQQEDYRIWRYTTENTIPKFENGTATAGQRIGITTGVAFRGYFTPVEEKRETWNGNVVYVYDNIVYGDLAALDKYCAEHPEAFVTAAYKLLNEQLYTQADPKPEVVEGSKINVLANLDADERCGFTAYVPNTSSTPESPAYEMYYFYYNRHNTNNNNFNMGENEFGVVRNNVYKLKVTTCGRLGAPEADDDPDTPNETENAYFAVSCEVMPWTVRVNNIEF